MPNKINIGKNPAAGNNYFIQASPGHVTSDGSPFTGLIETVPSGTFAHNGQVVINGTGFGTKSRGMAPLYRDYGQDGVGKLNSAIAAGAQPVCQPGYTAGNLQNRAIGFNPNNLAAPAIGAPHPFVQCILAGSHYTGLVGSNFGSGMQIPIVLPSFTGPLVLFAHHYKRTDPAWSFTPGETQNDQNYKAECTDSITGIGPTATYIGCGSGVTNNTFTQTQYVLASNANNMFESPDRNGSTNNRGAVYCGSGFTYCNPGNGWFCNELEMCLDQTTGPTGQGYFDIWQSNSQPRALQPVSIANYAGRTDGASGTTRYFTFGGGTFSRDYGPGYNNNTAAVTNYEYCADLYFDCTAVNISGGGAQVHCARVMATDNAVYANSILKSPCVITSWSNTQIVCTFWKDRFVSGQNVYFHVVTEIGGIKQNQLSGVVA